MKLKFSFLPLILLMLITACANKVGFTAADIKPGKDAGTIATYSFKQIYDTSPETFLIVDVRSPEKFSKGSFKGAVNIPIDDLMKRTEELNTGKPIIFICTGGVMAGEAYDVMQILNPELNSYYLNAGITFKADGTYSIVDFI